MKLPLTHFGTRRVQQRLLLFGAIVAVTLGLGGAGLLGSDRARADSNTINFDTYTLGTINGQDGWSSTGPYDREVVTSGGGKALRISNAVTSGSFGDQTFSKSLVDEAGEASAVNDGMSGGTRQNRFESQFTLSSFVPGAQQPGLTMSVSPDRGDGARMSYLRFEDRADGVHVFFDAYQDASPFGTFNGDPAGCGAEDDFTDSDISTISRTAPHTIKFDMGFVDGSRNDVVKIYIDSVLVKTGTSWEDYFRYCEGNPTRPVDSMLFRSGGTAAPATAGNGFLIDDLTNTSSTTASTTTVTTVTASSMTAAGWGFFDDVANIVDPTLGSFVTGPGTPAFGTGSVQISVTGSQRRNVATALYGGTPLANIDTLRFRTYNPSVGNGGSANRSAYLNFNVDFNASNTYQNRLVYVPNQNGTVVQNSWQEWDAIGFGTAKWSYSGATWPITGQPGTTLKSWSQILTDYPSIRTLALYPFIGLRVGEPYPDGYTENIDTFTFGTASSTTVFNFEDSPPCTTVCYVNATTGNDAFDGSTATSAKKTIQGGINAVSVGGTVNVAAGTYNEDVAANKAGVQLLGAGIDTSYIVGPIGGPGATIQVTANGVLVDGFTITRAGNNVTDWPNPALNSAGVAVQSQGNTVELRNSKLTGNRTGIDVNNSNGNSIHNNIIDNNRTGLIFRNTTNSTSMVNNFITNNWTDGVLFLDGSGGTNIPVQSAAGSTFSNNNISGNWYGQAEDRQSGGAIPIAPANPKNFELNWWGTTAVSVTTAQAGEPGYAAQIPVAFGGSATPPGGQPDIKGSSSANIDYDPMQCAGTDTSPAVGFQPSGVLCSPSVTNVLVSPSNLNGWYFWNDFNDTFTGSPGAFVTGPATPPLGTGSVDLGPLTTAAGATSQSVIATDAYFGTPITNITSLSYDSNQAGPTLAIALQFDVRYRTADTLYGGRLVFEPYQNGTVTVGSGWQSWTPLSGKWWASKTTAAGSAGLCPQSAPCTWAAINAAFPAAQVYGRFMLKSGSNWSGFDGNADNLKIGISGTNNKIFNFEPDCSTDCYVRTDGNDTNTGIANTAADAKRTIQAAATTVTSGGTVHVAAGTYDENVTITKPLTLVGAGQGSTFVRPGVSNPNCNGGGGGSLCSNLGPATSVMLVQADNVTIHDLTLDGDNTTLVSGIVAGGADLNARNGIITNHLLGVYQNLVVHHTTIKNVFLRGIYASSGGTFNFHDDTVDNVQADPASIGMFNFGGSGTFANNAVSNTNDAISSNHSRGTQFLNNTVTLSASGVHTDNAGDGGGVADLLDGNIVTNCTVNGYGVWTFVPYIQPTVKRNKITNCAVGMAATGSFAPVGTLFEDNEVDGASAIGSTGVYITTDLFGFGTEHVSATLTGNIIKNNDVGIDADAQAPKTTTINASRNSIFGNATGVALSNNPTPPVLPGPIGAFSLKMAGNWWGSATGPAHALNPGGTGNSVPNGVSYSPWLGIGTDSAPGTKGFQLASPMTWVAGQNVCDVTCIQKAVDFASPGDTINVLAGTFNEQVQINKSNLLINGAGKTSTFVKPSAVVANTNRLNTNAAATIFDVESATAVNIQNLTADGSLNGLTSCAPDFLGFYYKKASGNLTNVAASHVKLSPALLGCQTGVGLFIEADSPDIANVVVNNATITDYQKGGVVANRTGTTVSISNSTVTGIGPTTQVAANGIQVAFGATGTLTNNNVSANDFTLNTAAATGILLFQAAAANVTGNNIHDNQEGLDIEASNGVIVSTNSFAATRDVAIYANASSSGSYTGNIAMGQPGSTGIYVFDVSSNNTVTGNAFRNGDFGVVVDFGGGAPAGNLFNGNCLAGNIGAGVETLGTLVGPKINAKNNWWGAVNGATPPGNGDSIIPGDGSTIDPSLFLTAPVAGCPTPTTDTDGDGLTDVAEVNIYGTDPYNPDTDGDGCHDGKEVGLSHLAGGERNPKLDGAGQWDFFDVPVPALLPSNISGTRNNVISLADVLAVLTYVGTSAANPNSANANGAKYGSDLNSNSVVDGREYDRTPSVVPGQAWHSGAPNGVVSLGDVLTALAQVGTNCN